MSILLLFGINVCMESNKINLKLLNLGQISKQWLVSSNGPLQFGQLENRRNKHKLILFYKILNGLTPAYLYELVQPYLPRQSGYNLRNENNTFHPPFSRSKVIKFRTNKQKMVVIF
jgi:hypothetical protein